MLDKFAKLLGVRRDQAEDALQSERAAKLVVSRRSFLGVGAALATGALFSFPGVEAEAPQIVAPQLAIASSGRGLGSTLTTFDALLRERYLNSDRIEPLLYPPSPILGMLEKPKRKERRLLT